MPVKILLLRGQDGEQDKYFRCFQLANKEIHSSFIPVLDFGSCNLSELAGMLENWQSYSGAIFTSGRAVEGFIYCLNQFCEVKRSMILSQLKDSWTFFVVGQGTALQLVKSGISVLGESCGNADQLAKFITENYKSLTSSDKPLIFFSGNLSRETILKVLPLNGVAVTSLCVYETKPNPNFESLIEKYAKSYGRPDCIVFFSPSGVEFSLQYLRFYLNELVNVKLVAIGSTTAEALTSQSCQCDGVSKKPTPEYLLEAILNALELDL